MITRFYERGEELDESIVISSTRIISEYQHLYLLMGCRGGKNPYWRICTMYTEGLRYERRFDSLLEAATEFDHLCRVHNAYEGC